MRVIITGGTGFIGSRLIQELDNLEVPLFLVGRRECNVLGHNQNVVDDLDLPNLIQDFKPSIAIDLATSFSLYPKIDQLQSFLDGTLNYHVKISKILAETNCRIIYTGSFGQRLQTNGEKAISEYHFFKQTTENYFQNFFPNPLSIVDIFDTYALNDPRGKLISTLLSLEVDQQPLELSPGYQLLNLLHVDDVVSALVIACKNLSVQKEAKTHFSIRDNRFYSLREIVSIIEAHKGIKLPISWGKRDYRPGEIFEEPNMVDQVPGWTPKIDFEQWVSEL
jgi:CDP-3, 6-dideoxy-D-glycero-L-glycero-4-hexulose-4-reductase